MKTVVFIIGTNAVGKTTLAKEIIRRCGGVAREEGRSTVCRDGRTVLAGKFSGVKHGGVDGLNETRCLADMAREAFRRYEVFVCEGSYMNTFGINLTNALFTGERHLVVFLYAPIAVIDGRLKDRTAGGHIKETIILKQRLALASSRKWADIGVPVLSFNTADVPATAIADAVCAKIDSLCI